MVQPLFLFVVLFFFGELNFHTENMNDLKNTNFGRLRFKIPQNSVLVLCFKEIEDISSMVTLKLNLSSYISF